MTKLSAKPKYILPSSGATKKRIVTYSLRPWLEEGETVTVASVSCVTSNVTLSACTISDDVVTVEGQNDPAGTVVSFFISGTGVADGVTLTVLLDVTTSEEQDIEDIPITLIVSND